MHDSPRYDARKGSIAPRYAEKRPEVFDTVRSLRYVDGKSDKTHD